jgi:hypothetical protein
MNDDPCSARRSDWVDAKKNPKSEMHLGFNFDRAAGVSGDGVAAQVACS